MKEIKSETQMEREDIHNKRETQTVKVMQREADEDGANGRTDNQDRLNNSSNECVCVLLRIEGLLRNVLYCFKTGFCALEALTQ